MFLTSPLIDQAIARFDGSIEYYRDISPIEGNSSAAFTPCAYVEVLRRHKRRISQASKQRATEQITTPPQTLAQIAVARAEVPKAKAIKKQKAAPIRARNPIS